MDNLRLILLIIGCLFVLGIYLWEVFFKSDERKSSDILDAVDDLPGPVGVSEITAPSIQKEHPDDNAFEIADLGSLLAKSKNENAIQESESISVLNAEEKPLHEEEGDPLPMQMSVKDYEASITGTDDFESPDIVEDVKEQDDTAYTEESTVESEADEIEESRIPENNQNTDDLVVLYITSPKHTQFNGLIISKVADEVGMIYGHMNIFHHFGPGKLHSGQPLFSMANMYEPGSFDLGKMAELKTKGIAVFMYSPASIDATIVFELFLNTTQRIAESLGGEIRTSKNDLLTDAEIKVLRDKAESLSIK